MLKFYWLSTGGHDASPAKFCQNRSIHCLVTERKMSICVPYSFITALYVCHITIVSVTALSFLDCSVSLHFLSRVTNDGLAPAAEIESWRRVRDEETKFRRRRKLFALLLRETRVGVARARLTVVGAIARHRSADARASTIDRNYVIFQRH